MENCKKCDVGQNIITDLDHINLASEEGKLLFAALAKITTESQTNKTPCEVLAQLNKLADEMGLRASLVTLRRKLSNQLNEDGPSGQ